MQIRFSYNKLLKLLIDRGIKKDSAGVDGFWLGREASGIKTDPIYTSEIDDNCEKNYNMLLELLVKRTKWYRNYSRRGFVRIIRVIIILGAIVGGIVGSVYE